MSGLPWVYDDGGRALAGFRGDAGDCVVRAIAIAAGLPYVEVYEALADGMSRSRVAGGGHARSARSGVYKAVYRRYVERELGWSFTPTMQIGSGCRVHLAVGELPAGRLVAVVSKHVCAVVDGIVRDTHDPCREGTRCVYGYFRTDS